ncbi:hypothetical protein BASA81_008584 [Batrachochytrium salamandrivorans]|nr:hypothetical protein BASA81_008584 [Batrachochytrium salamandrivorans]
MCCVNESTFFWANARFFSAFVENSLALASSGLPIFASFIALNCASISLVASNNFFFQKANSAFKAWRLVGPPPSSRACAVVWPSL